MQSEIVIIETNSTAGPIKLLSVAEKEARIHDMLVQEGRDARETGENVNWRIGRAAVAYAKTFAADSEGNVDEKKCKPCLKEYALAIGMIDNHHRIYEFHDVAAFWPESAQAHFKDVTWSRFRECQRHCRDLSHASTILHQYGDAPVAKVREAILGKPSQKTKRVAWVASSASITEDWLTAHIVDDGYGLQECLREHKDAKVTVLVEYTEATA